MAEYVKSDYYKDIAEQVIDAIESLHFIKEYGIRIAYRQSDQAKKNHDNIVYADCEKVSDKNKMYMGYDFVITVYEPNVKEFDTNRIKVLLWHELCHIGANTNDMGLSTHTVPHDFEEFYCIYNRFGLGWQLRDDIPDICE